MNIYNIAVMPELSKSTELLHTIKLYVSTSKKQKASYLAQIKALLNGGADPYERRENGDTALFIVVAAANAKTKTDMELFNLLTTQAASRPQATALAINGHYIDQNTLPHYAVLNDDYALLKRLHELKADLSLFDRHAQDPLRFAIFMKKPIMVTALLNYGCKYKGADAYGYTPLTFARDYVGSKECVKALQDFIKQRRTADKMQSATSAEVALIDAQIDPAPAPAPAPASASASASVQSVDVYPQPPISDPDNVIASYYSQPPISDLDNVIASYHSLLAAGHDIAKPAVAASIAQAQEVKKLAAPQIVIDEDSAVTGSASSSKPQLLPQYSPVEMDVAALLIGGINFSQSIILPNGMISQHLKFNGNSFTQKLTFSNDAASSSSIAATAAFSLEPISQAATTVSERFAAQLVERSKRVRETLEEQDISLPQSFKRQKL